MKITQTEENYIKAIFKLEQDETAVTTNAIAAELQTKPASVTDMARKLRDKKWVHYERYHGISLTAAGSRIALSIIRRHRLWECFLVEKLHFSWEEVHELAEELEHIKSTKLTERLSEFLGHPGIDPHGDPIPDASGRMDSISQKNLLQFTSNQPVVVSGVGDQSPALLELLNEKGIALGSHLEVTRQFSFDQSVEVKLNHRHSFIISEMVAKNIFVRPYEKKAIHRRIAK